MVVLMLTVIAVSWLFVAPLLGPRATWHFVAKLFFGSVIEARLLWRAQALESLDV